MTDVVTALLARVGKTPSQVAPTSRLAKVLRRDGVPASPEVERVRALPRVEPVDPAHVELLHDALRLRDDVALRERQAACLLTAMRHRFLFAPLRVGAGKTLVSLLLPVALGSERPVLVVPAALRDKTLRDAEGYARAWRIAWPRIVTYHDLSNRPELLDEIVCDSLTCDEAHRLRDLSAGRTRRVERWLHEHPDVPLCLLSGTLIGERLMSWHHLAEWTFGPQRMPLPAEPAEAKIWAKALDLPRDGSPPELAMGALSWLGDPKGFGTFVAETPGVVSTPTQGCDAKIVIRRWSPPLPEALRAAIAEVEATGLRPDGEPLSDAEIVDVQQQLSLGFYYVWDPLPPDGWREARGEWLDLVALYKRKRRKGLDTEGEIATYIEAKGGQERAILAAWRAASASYKPPQRAIWIDDAPLRAVVEKATHGTLIWHRYRAVGARLEQLGIPHFADGGYSRDGRYVEQLDGAPCSLSIKANVEGRNLQAWHRNLVLTMPASPEVCEQLLGRTHRELQQAAEILVDVYAAIEYQRRVIEQVRSAAGHLGNVAANTQKLTLAAWAEEQENGSF